MGSGILVRMQTGLSQKQPPTLVSFHPEDASIRCGGCLQRLPLSKHTMRNQARIVEEIEMMQSVHKDCEKNAISQSYLRKTWRENMLAHHYNDGGRHPDRLVFSI